jgi:hypothetical protein
MLVLLRSRHLRSRSAEFGGAKPRLAQLSLVRDSISPEVVQLLTESTAITAGDKVVSSKCISVLFVGDERLIIDPCPDDANNMDRVEVPRDVVKAIRWYRPAKASRDKSNANKATLVGDANDFP